jgi:hypothetical protein
MKVAQCSPCSRRIQAAQRHPGTIQCCLRLLLRREDERRYMLEAYAKATMLRIWKRNPLTFPRSFHQPHKAPPCYPQSTPTRARDGLPFSSRQTRQPKNSNPVSISTGTSGLPKWSTLNAPFSVRSLLCLGLREGGSNPPQEFRSVNSMKAWDLDRRSFHTDPSYFDRRVIHEC